MNGNVDVIKNSVKVKASLLEYVACCAELLHTHFFVPLDEISQETKSVYRTKLLILFVHTCKL